jgi:hypothetical protein
MADLMFGREWSRWETRAHLSSRRVLEFGSYGMRVLGFGYGYISINGGFHNWGIYNGKSYSDG